MYKIQLMDNFTPESTRALSQDSYFIEQTERPNGMMVRSSIVADQQITRDLLAISRVGVGVNTINVEKCTENGTVVLNTPGTNANAVKELVVASLLIAVRPIFTAVKQVKELRGSHILAESEAIREKLIGHELQGKTVGILGLGSIGKQVGRICYELGMDVLGYARSPHDLSFLTQVALTELLKQSDFIVILLPLTAETNHLLNDKAFNLMKSGTCLLNFGRDQIVDNQALLAAIDQGKIAQYITDFPQAEFIGHDKIIMLPHIGGNTHEAIKDGEQMASRHLRNFLLYGTVRDSVNYPNARLLFQAPYRLTLFYQDSKGIWAEIVAILAQYELEIGDMSSNRKNGNVYTMIDLDTINQEKIEKALVEMTELVPVRRVRLLTKPVGIK
ncbi:hydroxyacid dehydrogenase [Vagococcus sp. BWB3-3]|uniref:D-3-phosphoglycerate dehydrogenase n=1 Tax=Vagococcus allomyrinae TaxID=2794353 RepID=A0A940PEP1_9ENTE|nr:NAD(P)-dependent oxidoreductase [Vagococcus allomyrinae]MBP1042603.1 hydroxyacid dehydrogenase [Vagococcus allomyrinae]